MTDNIIQQPPDQASRDCILNGLDTTILVEAAAGTGKTTSLVGRMTALLREQKTSVDSLAAITFTRKAAAELRARFQAALEKENQNPTAESSVHIANALQNIDRCFIGTIHSFCARLLRERPVEAGVDPGFEEIDDDADGQLRNQAWDEYIDRLYGEDNALIDELTEMGLQPGQLKETFLRFADFPDVENWPVEKPALPNLSEVVRRLREYADHMTSMSKSFPDDIGNDRLMPLYRTVPRLVRYADPHKLSDWMDILDSIGFKPYDRKKVVQKQWPGGKEQALYELDTLNQFIEQYAKPWLNAWRVRRYELIMRVLQPARERYDKIRHMGGWLNFQDLLMAAARLLRNHPHVRRYFRKRFSHLLVDEFQDTDPIQAEVMLLLTADNTSEPDWSQCQPVPGSLFVVGDPKQSIYRFRRADIVTYNQVKTIIEQSGGKVLSLSANFRTQEPILHWVNQTFHSAFSETADEFSPAYVNLEPGKTEQQIEDPQAVTRLLIPEDYSKNDDVMLHESHWIARLIRAAINEGSEPGDFMIITRNRSHLSDYARQLEYLEIPHQVTGGSSMNEVPELELLYRCLMVLINPDNPIHTVSVLRSGLFGISDEELFHYKQAGGAFSFRAPVPETLPQETQDLFNEAFEHLKTYAHWFHRYPPVAAIERMIEDSGLLALAAAKSAGSNQAGSLLKAIELLRQKQADTWSLEQIVNQLGYWIHHEEVHDSIPVHPGQGSYVRLMNLHKVKGLEAPVVFLADPSGKYQHPVDIHIDRTQGRSSGFLAVLKRSGYQNVLLAHPHQWEQYEEKEKTFLDAEEKRLFYVAATRAGKRMIISQRKKNNHHNPWNFFSDALGDVFDIPDPGRQAVPIVNEIRIDSTAPQRALEAITCQWDMICTPTYETQHAKQVSQSWTKLDIERDEHGAQWGTLIHMLLEARMSQPECDLASLAASFLADSNLDSSLLDEAIDTVQSVIHSHIWERAQQSTERYVEIPFETMILPPEEKALPILQRGVIDLIFREKTGWVIVDYKTDRVTSNQLHNICAHYLPQIQTYVERWEEITREAVLEKGLYFVYLNEYVVI